MRYKLFDADPDALLTEVDAGDLLKLSIRTLQAWRARAFGPTFVRVGRAIRYRRRDLDEWVRQSRVRTNQALEQEP
jgi:hypothetical protein